MAHTSFMTAVQDSRMYEGSMDHKSLNINSHVYFINKNKMKSIWTKYLAISSLGGYAGVVTFLVFLFFYL